MDGGTDGSGVAGDDATDCSLTGCDDATGGCDGAGLVDSNGSRWTTTSVQTVA